MNRKYDILTFGDMCVDLVVTGQDVVPEFGQIEKLVDNYTVEMGGSCCIFACQAAKLGLKVAILGRVGKDRFGEVVLSRLQESGVDTRFAIIDEKIKTGLGIALCQGSDRAILTYPGSLNAIEPTDVTDDLLQSARHLHHGSYYLQTRLKPAIPDIFQRAKKLNLSISLDTNWDPEDKWGNGLKMVLPLVNVFIPNEQEALRIAKTRDIREAIHTLHKMGTKYVIIKQGENGAMASDGNHTITERVDPVTGGDSIGAGDSFDAGFLAGWLNKMRLEECIHIGCICGRSVAASVGGIEGQPTWEHLKLNHRK